jgi:hypothetical protein
MTITLTREEAQLLWEALESASQYDDFSFEMKTLRARLSAPEPEPVVWRTRRNDTWSYHHNKPHGIPHEPLYAAPPQRGWQGLTDEEVLEIWSTALSFKEYHRAIEAKLKEKNNDLP